MKNFLNSIGNEEENRSFVTFTGDEKPPKPS